jgi:two-component system, OmpR family, response regulator
MRILLVEDDRKVANFIARSLKENVYAVDIAETGVGALRLAKVVKYDAVILDVILPGISGIEVCRRFKGRGIVAPVMMLSARSSVEQRVEGLDVGAADYLTMPFVLSEFLARVRSLVRRGFPKAYTGHRYADLELDRNRLQATRGTSIIHLSAKETAILEFLLLRAPDLVTRTEIIEHIWNHDYQGGTNLIEAHISRLRKKMGLPRLIHTARAGGYRLGLGIES